MVMQVVIHLTNLQSPSTPLPFQNELRRLCSQVMNISVNDVSFAGVSITNLADSLASKNMRQAKAIVGNPAIHININF